MTADRQAPPLISPAAREKALACGAGRWLDALPGLVAELAAEWSLTIGRPYPGSTESFTTRVRLAGGRPAVLKLIIPRLAGPPADAAGPFVAARREIAVLTLAAGRGCARLLRADAARGALLTERLGRPLSRLGLPLSQRLEILTATAQRIWRPAPGCGLPTGRQKARWLAEDMIASWEQLGRPCSERAVSFAVECAHRRAAAHDDGRAVLIHGDVHQWNALRAGRGFRLVDPDGLLAEPECDLGVLMREDPRPLMRGDPRQRARWLARRCGLDAAAIWEWGAAERVSTGLLCTRIGLQPVARQMLAAADHIAASQGPP